MPASNKSAATRDTIARVSFPSRPVNAAPRLRATCLGWARTRLFLGRRRPNRNDRVVVRSRLTDSVLRAPAAARLELAEADHSGEPRTTLFVADTAVLEMYLAAVSGDEVREELGLPFLRAALGQRVIG
jgi:hypothetical protein